PLPHPFIFPPSIFFFFFLLNLLTTINSWKIPQSGGQTIGGGRRELSTSDLMDSGSIITQVSKEEVNTPLQEKAADQKARSPHLITRFTHAIDITDTRVTLVHGDGSPLQPVPYVPLYQSAAYVHSYDALSAQNPSPSKKPRNRSIFQSLFCCLCHDNSEPLPVNNNAPLLVEENGSVPKATVKYLLPEIKPQDASKICVVIDLDETLVHSSFKPVNNADFIIPVEIDGVMHQVYVLKRPHVDEFLRRMGELFECVLFTASLAKYADPVADLLDKWGAFRARLFRESCVFHRGNYVKDLSRLGRDLTRIIIVDNSPASYVFHPDNAVGSWTATKCGSGSDKVPVASWFDNMADTELLDLLPFFERLSKVDDVYTVLKQHRTSS
ncbi:hypothetical protein lerEdw1_003332, partial [Lerista edwardsae]